MREGTVWNGLRSGYRTKILLKCAGEEPSELLLCYVIFRVMFRSRCAVEVLKQQVWYAGFSKKTRYANETSAIIPRASEPSSLSHSSRAGFNDRFRES